MHNVQLAETKGLLRLELCDGKLSCTVLRGGSFSNEAPLPDRKIGQKILIGDEITVTLIETKGNQVRIGIDAPPSVSIHRDDIISKEVKG